MASRRGRPTFSPPGPRGQGGKALLFILATAATLLLCAALARKRLVPRPGGGIPTLPWREVHPAEIFGAGS